MSFTSTSTNSSCTVLITQVSTSMVNKASMTKEERKAYDKEQRRLKQMRTWTAKAKVRAAEWFEAEMKRIRADCEANAWRPHVSNNPRANDFQLSYWTLGRASEDETYPEGGPQWQTYRSRYNKGWVGLTVTDVSPFEMDAINAFMATIKSKDKLISLKDDFDSVTDPIGEHTESCYGYWFRNLDDHNRFVEMLDNIPQRTQIFVLGEHADRESIETLVACKNYEFIEGSDETILSMCEIDETNAVLLKMFLG